jgi:hypothetical protein
MDLIILVVILAALWTLTPWWIALPVTLLGLFSN